MNDKTFGGNQSSYGAIEIPQVCIVLRVYHQNKTVRESLRKHCCSNDL
jgi:hypothetical protein